MANFFSLAQGAAARLSVHINGARSDEALAASMLAERHGLDQIWMGDPCGSDETYSDDRYVLTSLAAVAARTRSVRLGAILKKISNPGALPTPELLHVVEDLAVVDHASNGRVEVAFIPGGVGWIDHVDAALSLWTDGLTLDDGRVVALTPGPAQPTLPRLVVGAEVEAAKRLQAGMLVRPGQLSQTPSGRVVLHIDLSTSVREWLIADPVGQVLSLRAQIREARATEVMFSVQRQSMNEDIRVLGSVVLSAVHCAPMDVEKLTADAWSWYRDGASKWAEPDDMLDVSDEFLFRR